MSKKARAVMAVLAMALLTVSGGVMAEEAEGTEVEVEDLEELQSEKNVTFMFVQTAQSGTLVPVEGQENLFTLTLMGVAPQTIAFSDRPERIVAQAEMQQFLDGMCFEAENPPNAALEILDADEEEDVAVVELFDPVYDNESQTLQYNVSILEMPDHSYAVFNERADQALPETFGPATLFIDDCSDGWWRCCTLDGTFCGKIKVGRCYNWAHARCEWCSYDHGHGCTDSYGSQCEYDCGN
ncbi:hypothetical protein [Methanothrix harundinacea]|jgi:hypothetical protein|nr:hypothetical protein [Methanothrix harundinacea]